MQASDAVRTDAADMADAVNYAAETAQADDDVARGLANTIRVGTEQPAKAANMELHPEGACAGELGRIVDKARTGV